MMSVREFFNVHLLPLSLSIKAVDIFRIDPTQTDCQWPLSNFLHLHNLQHLLALRGYSANINSRSRVWQNPSKMRGRVTSVEPPTNRWATWHGRSGNGLTPKLVMTGHVRSEWAKHPFVMPPDEKVFHIRALQKKKERDDFKKDCLRSVVDKSTFASRSGAIVGSDRLRKVRPPISFVTTLIMLKFIQKKMEVHF